MLQGKPNRRPKPKRKRSQRNQPSLPRKNGRLRILLMRVRKNGPPTRMPGMRRMPGMMMILMVSLWMMSESHFRRKNFKGILIEQKNIPVRVYVENHWCTALWGQCMSLALHQGPRKLPSGMCSKLICHGYQSSTFLTVFICDDPKPNFYFSIKMRWDPA